MKLSLLPEYFNFAGTLNLYGALERLQGLGFRGVALNVMAQHEAREAPVWRSRIVVSMMELFAEGRAVAWAYEHARVA